MVRDTQSSKPETLPHTVPKSSTSSPAPSPARTDARIVAWATAHPLGSTLLLTALLTLLLYARALTAGFAPYDDPIQIVNNPALHSISSSLTYLRHPVSFTSDLRGSGDSFYRPLFWISLALDRSLWGLNPVAFHLTNLVLHWLSSVLLFLLLRRLALSYGLALATTLLWLSLPINSEVVAWISGRPYGLSTLFLLAALLLAGRYLKPPAATSTTPAKPTALVDRTPPSLIAGLPLLTLYLLCATLALLSHEGALLLLPLTALVALHLRQPLSRRAITLYAATAALDLAYAGLRLHLTASLPAHPGALSTLAPTLARYFGWILLPLHMSIERSSSTPIPGWSPLALLAWAATLVLLAAAIVLRRRYPRALLGLAWTLVCLLPYSGLTLLYQGMAERYTYLASIGIALLLCSLCFDTPRPARRLLTAALALWALWGITRLELRISDWRDPTRLYASSLQATPRSFKLHYNLGALHEEAGRFPEALSAYGAALAINPTYEPAIAGTGNVFLQQNDAVTARGWYMRALALDHNDAKTITNYGTALQKLGQLNDAKAQYLRAIALAPTDDSAYCDLAVLFFGTGANDIAELLLKKAISVAPADTLPLTDLAALYIRTDRPADAIPLYRKILTIDPSDTTALAGLQTLTRPQPK